MSKRKKKRDLSAFSLSFLDCISCGFGAVILLFVISMGSERLVEFEMREVLNRLFQQRLAELRETKSEREEFAERVAQQDMTRQERKEEIARLQTNLEELLRQIAEARHGIDSMLVVEDETREEIDARQRMLEVEQREIAGPVGLPVEFDHFIFIIDTSGSQRNMHGLMLPQIIAKMSELLEMFPTVEGMQMMDADGAYMVSRNRGDWIRDTPESRRNFLSTAARYERHSRSNPVPGIMRAIRAFGDPEIQVAIFVLGDEFTHTADPVIEELERLNPRLDNGRRLVSINGIGFPQVLLWERHHTQTGMKFANLMREVAYLHDGAFIGMVDQSFLSR